MDLRDIERVGHQECMGREWKLFQNKRKPRARWLHR